MVFQLSQESEWLVFSLQDKVMGELEKAYHGDGGNLLCWRCRGQC